MWCNSIKLTATKIHKYSYANYLIKLIMNYFELFNLPESVIIDKDYLRGKYQDLQKEFHPDKVNEVSFNILDKSVMVNEAYRVLSHDVRRLSYIIKLKGIIVNEENATIKPSMNLLMEVLEIHEIINRANDVKELKSLEANLKAKFSKMLMDADNSLKNDDLAKAAEIAISMQYIDKILIEIKNEIIRHI
ncbi:MAG: Fe-S protein assembly co-chaperone HscB [Alphaproteobacteria bacterium 33-17]|nr:MAG: Fe-S protein assembly co-chaperone HscB [Alphaproteobacteria bacterium 33-17]